jgi:acyl carrier protein
MAITVAGCSNDAAKPAGAEPDQLARSSPPLGTVPPVLRSTIAATLKVEDSKVTPTASFTGDLHADELAMVELVMAYEREFRIDISDADADHFKHVQDVTAYLQKRRVLR